MSYSSEQNDKEPEPNPYKKHCGTVVSPIWTHSYNLAKPCYVGVWNSYKKISSYWVVGKGSAELPEKYQKEYSDKEHFTILMEDGAKFFPDEESLQSYLKRYNESLAGIGSYSS